MIYILFTITIIYSIYLHFKINELEKYQNAIDDVFDDLCIKFDKIRSEILTNKINTFNKEHDINEIIV